MSILLINYKSKLRLNSSLKRTVQFEPFVKKLSQFFTNIEKVICLGTFITLNLHFGPFICMLL